jgi:hypothetical protein
MACCGNQRQQLNTSNLAQGSSNPVGGATPPRPAERQSAACFEYTGRTGMTVLGPVTGLRYRFNYPGERVFVDLRDRLSLLSVPNLRQVRNPAEG